MGWGGRLISASALPHRRIEKKEREYSLTKKILEVGPIVLSKVIRFNKPKLIWLRVFYSSEVYLQVWIDRFFIESSYNNRCDYSAICKEVCSNCVFVRHIQAYP